MFAKTKFALAAAIVLSTAFAASAATRSQGTQVNGSAFYTMIPSYDKNGGVVTVPDPDHYGQLQSTGDLTVHNH